LTFFTFLGFCTSALIVMWLLNIGARAWVINNAVFFTTLAGLIVGIVAMARTISTEYFAAYRREVIEKEKEVALKETSASAE
jgi:uncharacterized membrane protein YcjF (UPF0283 family)